MAIYIKRGTDSGAPSLTAARTKSSSSNPTNEPPQPVDWARLDMGSGVAADYADWYVAKGC